MRRQLAAAFAAQMVLAMPSFSADRPLSLAAFDHDGLAAEAGAAHQLDLGNLSLTVPSGGEMLQIGYEINVGGFRLATIDLVAVVDHGHYLAGTQLATKGLADAFVSSDIQAVSTGDLHGRLVVPHTYNSDLKSTEKRQLLGLL
jgi:hypothetical protein